MFKKKAIKKPAAIRRRTTEDEDEDKNNDTSANADQADTSTAEQLAQIRKKRKLLTSVQYKRGVDATQLLQRAPVDAATTNIAANENKTTAVKTAAETSRDGALDRKHRQAMEAFIEERMGGKEKAQNDSTQQQEEKESKSQLPLTEEALYMDLAAQSARLAGRTTSDDQQPINTDDQDEQRGAVLVAGTGIAEVILPVTERLKVAQETQAAQQQAAASRRQRPNTAAASVPAGVPNRFAVASNLTHQEFNRQYDRNAVSTTTNSNNNDTASADAARPGFDAMRQPSRPSTGSASTSAAHSRRDQATDHKVYAKFVTRQREMRK